MARNVEYVEIGLRKLARRLVSPVAQLSPAPGEYSVIVTSPPR
jgi:hypothetical protein